MHHKALFLAVVSLLLCGCAERSLTRQQISTIPELEVVVGVAQNELAIQQIDPIQPLDYRSTYRPATGSDGALAVVAAEALVAIIVGGVAGRQQSRRTELQARAAILKQALDGYDFRAELLDATKATLAQVRSVKVDVRSWALTNTFDGTLRRAYADSTASAVLFFLVAYSLEEGRAGYGLVFRSNVFVFPKSTALKALRRRPDDADPVADGNAIHRKTVEFFLPYDGKADIKEVLRRGAWGLAAQLAADLELK